MNTETGEILSDAFGKPIPVNGIGVSVSEKMTLEAYPPEERVAMLAYLRTKAGTKNGMKTFSRNRIFIEGFLFGQLYAKEGNAIFRRETEIGVTNATNTDSTGPL